MANATFRTASIPIPSQVPPLKRTEKAEVGVTVYDEVGVIPQTAKGIKERETGKEVEAKAKAEGEVVAKVEEREVPVCVGSL